MCGRLFQSSSPDDLKRWFGTANLPNTPARYNVAPTQDIAAVRFNPKTGARSLDLLRWGLIPHWSKDKSVGVRMINAQAESIATKPAFRDAFQQRRCIIPADGFYEWGKLADGGKQAYVVRMKGGALFGFAGLWENWRQPDGIWLRSCTIVTVPANALCAPIHDRMPAILAFEDYAPWLGEAGPGGADPGTLLRSFPSEAMELYPVGPAVGNFRNDDPSLIAPLASA